MYLYHILFTTISIYNISRKKEGTRKIFAGLGKLLYILYIYCVVASITIQKRFHSFSLYLHRRPRPWHKHVRLMIREGGGGNAPRLENFSE
jgi:hypothetical protein